MTFNIAGIGTGLTGTVGSTTLTTATFTYTTTATALTAGNHAVSASYVHSGSFADSIGTLSGGQTVNQKHITGSFTADNKVYDGNDLATVLTQSLSGVIGGDMVTLDGDTATFDDKNIGTGKTVTLATLTGADAGNYVLDSVAPTTADITAAHVIGTFTALDKMFDGDNTAMVGTRSLNGVIGDDDVSLTGGTATFEDKEVGNHKIVTLTGASLIGVGVGNYVLDNVDTATANIT